MEDSQRGFIRLHVLLSAENAGLGRMVAAKRNEPLRPAERQSGFEFSTERHFQGKIVDLKVVLSQRFYLVGSGVQVEVLKHGVRGQV